MNAVEGTRLWRKNDEKRIEFYVEDVTIILEMALWLSILSLVTSLLISVITRYLETQKALKALLYRFINPGWVKLQHTQQLTKKIRGWRRIQHRRRYHHRHRQ